MAIKYFQIQPSLKLSGYVKYFWVGEVAASREKCFTHLSIATRSPKLVFHYKGQFAEVMTAGKLQPSFLSGIQGPSKTHKQFVSYEQVGIFGIEFFPYALPALFSTPAAALTNQFVDIATLLGIRGLELEDRIFSANTTQERVDIATSFLESLIKAPVKSLVIAAVQMIDESKGQIDTNTLLNKIPISQRQLERLFRELVGFSPKQYARIARFEAAVSNLRKQTSFTALALDVGYYDQAHFNHDFMEFTGLHPQGYLKAISNLPIQQC